MPARSFFVLFLSWGPAGPPGPLQSWWAGQEVTIADLTREVAQVTGWRELDIVLLSGNRPLAGGRVWSRQHSQVLVAKLRIEGGGGRRREK